MNLKFLFLLLLLLLSTSSLYADNTRVWGWCEKGGQYVVGPGASQSTNKVQASYPGCTVTVFIAGGTTPISIYNQDGTPLSNPFTASSTTGYWFFYVPNGRYDVTLSGAGFTTPFTLGDITVGGSGGGGSGCGVTSTCTIPQGGTSATTATDATHNLQYNAGTSPTPADGAVAVADDAALNLHISVTYFNADTGLTDNSTAFNDTVSYLVSRGGGEMFVPCGVYNFTNPITIDTQKVSMIGESEHCVVLNYVGTGTFLNIVDQPPTGGPHGEYKNFTIQLPSGNASTIGLLSSTSNALYENIQTTSCAASTAYFISNGVIQSPVSPSYEEKNTWINVNSDHCGTGWEVGSTGNPPTDNFINYNYFDNISGSASMGQIVFQVDSGPWFQHNYLNLSCKIDNVTTISTNADAICIQSNGKWQYNTTFLNGEWNNSIGTGTGNPFSVQITPGGQFLNTFARLNVFAIPGLGGARVPMNNQAGASAVSNFQIGADTDMDWAVGSGAPSTAPVNGSLYTDSVDGSLYVRQASAWLKLGSGGGGGGAWNPPASGSNCVVKFDTGATTECVPAGVSGYIFQDGAGNISAQPGTGGTAASVTYTPTGTNAGATNLQVRSDTETFVTLWKNGAGNLPVCGDTATDNSGSLINAMNHSHVVKIPANCMLTIDNVPIPSQTTIQCDGNQSNSTGLLHLAGATTHSMLTTAGNFEVALRGCTIDGNGVNSSQPLVNIGTNSSSVNIEGNMFRQASAPAGLAKDIQIFQSSARVLNNTLGDNPSGTFLTVDFGSSTTNRVLVQGNTISGTKDNAIVVERSGTPGYCNFLVSGNTITNVTDSGHGTGPDGNGILDYQCFGGELANNHIDGTELSGIRMGQNSSLADVHDNEIWNAHEAAMYCSEEGGFGNHCHHNHIYFSTFGLNSTNQSMRALGLPDVIDNNYFYGMQYYGIHAEGAEVTNNHVVNSALCYQLGSGSSTGGNIFGPGNTCDIITTTGSGSASSYNNGTLATATNIEVDPGTSSSYIERVTSNPSGNYTASTGNGFLGTQFQLPSPIVGADLGVSVTGITNAASAVVSYTGTDSRIVVGNRACFFAVFGMTQANGQCPEITAVGSGTFTVALNTTSYGTYVAPTNGIFSNAQILWNNTTAAPTVGIGGTYQITGMDIPYATVAASSFANGSQFRVPDGGCTNGALTSGGGGTFVTKITSRLACVLDASGTVSSGNGITNGGAASGQIQMLDSTSGHTLTVTPQSGLPSNTTVNLPQ